MKWIKSLGAALCYALPPCFYREVPDFFILTLCFCSFCFLLCLWMIWGRPEPETEEPEENAQTVTAS